MRILTKILISCSLVLHLSAAGSMFFGSNVAAAGGGTITFTSKTLAIQGGGSVTSSITGTWSTPPVAGESIFCYAFFQAATATVTDSSGSNVYTGILVSPHAGIFGGFWFVQGFYKLNILSTITTTTLNFTGTIANPTIICSSATGVAGVDGTAGYNSLIGAGALTMPSITTTINGSAIFCAGDASAAASLTKDSTFTYGTVDQGPPAAFMTEYFIKAVAGAIVGTINNSTGNSEGICVGFHP